MDFSFKEVAELTVKRFGESPLGKLAEGKEFDKPMGEFDSPLTPGKILGKILPGKDPLIEKIPNPEHFPDDVVITKPLPKDSIIQKPYPDEKRQEETALSLEKPKGIEQVVDNIDDSIETKNEDSIIENSEMVEDETEGIESDEGEIKGGSYGDIRNNMKERDESGQEYQVHHMPSDSVTDLTYNDGPAIKMETEDHRQTASCGNSKEAQEYRAKQKELIEDGKFREAAQMDIDDIRDKFGDKYDEAIAEYEEYLDTLESKGEI